MSEATGNGSYKLWVLPGLAVLVLLLALIGSWVSNHTEPEHLPVAAEPPRPSVPVAPPVAARPPPYRPVAAAPPVAPRPPVMQAPPQAPPPPPAHVASVPAAAPIPAVLDGPPGPVIAPPPPGRLPSEDQPEEGGSMMKWRYQPSPGQKHLYPPPPPPGQRSPAEGQ